MDNTTDTPTSDDNQSPPICVTLNPAQYFRYQTHQLDINGPDGRFLGYFSKALHTENTEDNFFRLLEQIALVKCLLCDTSEGITLSIPAALGLTNLLTRIENFFSATHELKADIK